MDLKDIEKYYRIDPDGGVYSLRKKRHLKGSINNCGYPFICITTDKGSKWRFTHVLVALKYLGNRPEGHDVDHIDGDKTNNEWRNLQYITHSANIQKTYDGGRVSHWKGKKKKGPLSEGTRGKMAAKKHRPLMCRGVRYESVEHFCRVNGVNRRMFNRHYNKNKEVKGMYVRFLEH